MAQPRIVRPAGANAAADPRAQAEQFRLDDLMRVARERWRLVRNVALAVLALTVLVLLLLPSFYAPTALVMLDQRKNTVADLSAVLSDLPTDPSAVQNQIQILTSRDLAGQVIEQLGLVQDEELNKTNFLDPRHWFDAPVPTDPAEAAAYQYNKVTTAFLKRLKVEAEGLSTTVSVSFSSRDPAKAAQITNAVVDAYIAEQVAVKNDAAHKTTDWLVQRIGELAQQVQAAEANVQRYKAENGLNDTAEGTPLIDQQLTGIDTQLVQARADLAAKEASNDRVESLVQSGHNADVSQIVSSPLIVQLREQQADVIRDEALLTTRYGPRHPKLIAAESQKRDLDEKISQEVDRLAGSVANDVAVARAQVASLQNSLRQMEAQSTSQNLVRVKLKSLEANAATTRTMYEAFVTRLREAQDQDGIQPPDSHVISHASIPITPSSPPRLLIMAAAIPGSLMLGLLAALLAERMNVPVERVRQRPDPLRGVQVMAELPNALSARSADWVVDQPMSAFGRQARGLAQRIAYPAQSFRPKVIAVASAEPHEGKTAVALALARAASQLGQRVVLVDGNLLSPMVGWTARLGAAPAGLLEAAGGTAPLSRALQKDPRSNAYVLAPRGPFAYPPGVWASPQMAHLFAHLRQCCDLVIVDGVAMSAPEAPMIVASADAIMLVARWSAEPRPALEQTLDVLAAMHAPPVGLVLTS